MKINIPILSLCLPTNGATHWVLPTLDAIYSQVVDTSLFEVIITDNGENSSLEKALLPYHYSNLRYVHTKDSGFLNLITALKLGKGKYCKMLNHRSCLIPGALQMMIDVIEQYQETRPILYFSDGTLNAVELVECNNLDEFVCSMHYWTTWSGGVGVWQEDLATLDGLVLNELFPQSALMFDIRENSKYVICNRKFQDMQNADGKGGYDVFYAFAVEFPKELHSLFDQNRISQETYDYVMKQMFGFVYGLYYQEVLHSSNHTFIIQNVAQSIMVNYGLKGYIHIALRSRYHKIKQQVRKLVKKCIQYVKKYLMYLSHYKSGTKIFGCIAI